MKIGLSAVGKSALPKIAKDDYMGITYLNFSN